MSAETVRKALWVARDLSIEYWGQMPPEVRDAPAALAALEQAVKLQGEATRAAQQAVYERNARIAELEGERDSALATADGWMGDYERLREALERIAAMGVAADAKGSQSKRVMTIARAALTPTEEQLVGPVKDYTAQGAAPATGELRIRAYPDELEGEDR